MQQALIRSFDALPDDAWIRESQLIQGRRGSSPLAPLPFSSPTLWRKVKEGSFPAPTKLSERVTAWRVGDVRSWIQSRKEG